MVNVEFINQQRLTRWKVKLNRKHATPVLIVAIGHDHNEGETVIVTPEDVSDEQVLLFLGEALKQVQDLIAKKN